MKKTMKSIACLVLAGATVGLVACGGGKKNTNTTHIDTPWWTTTGELTMENGEPVFNNVSINLTTIVSGSDLTPFRAIIDEFNKEHSGKINVKVNNFTENVFVKNIMEAVNTGSNAPDLIMSHAKMQKVLADENYIQPLDEIIEATGYEIDWNNYAEVFVKDSNLNYDNATFTLPIDMQSEVVLYNKAILEELEMSVPSTYDDLMAVCEAFKERYTGSNQYAISMPTNNDHFHPYVYPTAYLQNGGSLYDVSTNKAKWSSSANAKAFTDATTVIKSFVEEGYMKLGENESDASNRFYADNTLFLVLPPWNITTGDGVFDNYGYIKGVSKNDSEFEAKMCAYIGGTSLAGLFALDSSKEYAQSVYVDSHSFSLSKSVKDITKKAACLYFAKWFTESGEAGLEWALAGHASCSSAILNNPVYANNTFVQELIMNFYDVNAVKTLGNNYYVSDFTKQLGDLTRGLLNASPTSYVSIIKSFEKNYNGKVGAEDYIYQ